MKKLENIFLYLVVLGGRAKKANIELHDVRWVVGSKIEDTYDTLRKDWFGSPKGLHIDSYKKIRYIDGYKINGNEYILTVDNKGNLSYWNMSLEDKFDYIKEITENQN